MANANVKVSEWQLKQSQLEVATQVKQVYWQLAYLHSKHTLLLFQDSLFSGFLRAAELRAKLGETNRLEMISARSQSIEVKNQLQQIVADLSILGKKLQTLINSALHVNPVDTFLRRIQFSPLSDSSAIASNPSVGYMQQQIEIAHLETKVERSRMMPDFSIGYFSQTMQGSQEIDGVPRTFNLGDRFTGIQAGIAVPLWFAPYSSKVKTAKLKQKITQIDAEYNNKLIQSNYNSLLGEYSKYSNSVDFYEKQAIPEADVIIDQTVRSYKAGAMDYLEYILSLNRALSIKQSYLDALNNYNQTIISIEFITGKIY